MNFNPLLKGLESREVISLTRAKKTAQNAEMSTSIILALQDVVLVQSDKPWTFIISIIVMDNLTFKYIWYTTVYPFYCVLKASKKQLNVRVLSLDGRQAYLKVRFSLQDEWYLAPKAVSWTYVDRTVQKWMRCSYLTMKTRLLLILPKRFENKSLQ